MSKNINFLSTPSDRHHKNVNRWYLLSCSTLLTLCVSLLFVSTQQIQRWYSMHNELRIQQTLQDKARSFVAKRTQLSQEKASLLKKTEEWEKYTHKGKKPSDMLNALKKNSDKNSVTSLRMVQRSVQFQMRVQTAQDGIIIAQNLSSTTIFDEVKLTSFKTDRDAKIAVTMEGELSA